MGETLQNDFKDFRIERLIGRGGMSIVYLAEQQSLGRKVALKVMSPALADDPAFRERFIRESKMAASLDHPNVIPIYEAGEAEGALYIAMRYVEASDLRTLNKRRGPLPVERVLSILSQVASALDTAHARGLVHRDVKPANILVAPGPGQGAQDHAYLADFGLTRPSQDRTGLTQTGAFVGTVDYAAPEQIEGKAIDGRTDQYALGCMLFECLTNTVPFQKDSNVAVIFSHVNEPPPKATERRAELPGAIDTVIARSMSKDMDDRFASCTELMDAARAALGGAPAIAPAKPRRASKTPAAASTKKRIPRWALPVGAFIVALAIVTPFLLKGGSTGSAAPSTHWVTFELNDKHIFRVQDRAGAVPIDLSASFAKLPNGALAKGATDEAVNISSNGKWIGLATQRFGCGGWQCLVILPADLSSVEVIHALPLKDVNDDRLIHAEGFAISSDGSMVVFRTSGGPHERDLWMIKRTRNSDWTTPELLTRKLAAADEKKFKFADLDFPAISPDDKLLVFDCHKVIYIPNAICQTTLALPYDYRVLVGPQDGPSPEKDSYAGHPTFTKEGGIVFEAAWQGIGDNVWRTEPGTGKIASLVHLVTPLSYGRMGSPCVLSNGRIAALWREDPQATDRETLITMNQDGTDIRVLLRTAPSTPTIIDGSIGCG